MSLSAVLILQGRTAHGIAAVRLQRKAHLKPDDRLTLFYSVCQAVCYIICYYGDLLKWGQSRLENPDSNGESPPAGDISFLFNGDPNLITILDSDLAPLVQCKRGIVKEFISTCRCDFWGKID